MYCKLYQYTKVKMPETRCFRIRAVISFSATVFEFGINLQRFSQGHVCISYSFLFFFFQKDTNQTRKINIHILKETLGI